MASCSKEPESSDAASHKAPPPENEKLSKPVSRYEKEINSKDFLIKHNLTAINQKIQLTGNKEFPKEIIGGYIGLKVISKGGITTKSKLDEVAFFIMSNGSASIGVGSSLQSIRIHYLKYVTVLEYMDSDSEFPQSMWLFSDNVIIIPDEGILIFLKKSNEYKLPVEKKQNNTIDPVRP